MNLAQPAIAKEDQAAQVDQLMVETAVKIAITLEQVFRVIEQERMQSVPILNPNLETRAMDFIPWQNYAMGILITPWFMNLMLVPIHEHLEKQELSDETADQNSVLAVGEKRHHALPSGMYEFIGGYEEAIGHYEMCSLFSPMFEFEDQAAAIATAKQIQLELMQEENRESLSMHENEIQEIWQGERNIDDVKLDLDMLEPGLFDSTDEVSNKQSTSKKVQGLKQDISRRDLLRGRIISSGGE